MRANNGMKRTDLLFSRLFLPHLHHLIRARIAICCSFFIQGLCFATWCSRIPDIQHTFALNDAQLGALLLILPLGELLSILPCAEAIRHFGSRRMLLMAGFGYPLLLCAIATAPSATLLAPLLFLTGAVANLSNTAANTQAAQLETLYQRSIMTLFHGMWSCAGLVAVLFALLFAQFHATIPLHFTAIAGSAALLLSFSGGALLPQDRATSSQKDAFSLKAWRPSPFILCIGLAALGCMVCEGIVYNWSGIYLRDALQAPSTSMSYGYFAYMCTMVPMRFVADRLINRLGHHTILLASALALILGLTTIVSAPSLPSTYGYILTLLGFSILGCGASTIVPICCSLAGKVTDRPPAIAIATVSMIGFLGFLAMPPIIGYISHLTSLRTAFASGILMGTLVLCATLILRKTTRKAV